MKPSVGTGPWRMRTAGRPCWRLGSGCKGLARGIARAVSGSAGENFPMERSRDDTDERGRLQAEAWAGAEQIWAPRRGQAGWFLRSLRTESLRF